MESVLLRITYEYLGTDVQREFSPSPPPPTEVNPGGDISVIQGWTVAHLFRGSREHYSDIMGEIEGVIGFPSASSRDY